MNKRQRIRDLMFRTEMMRKRRIHPIWSKMGLIAGQPRVLTQLLLKDRVTQKELSDACCIEPATLSRALDKLEAMGYISRNDNPDCRRSYLIALTGEGKSMAEAVNQAFAELEEQMLEGFSQEEMDVLYGFIGRIFKNLGGSSC